MAHPWSLIRLETLFSLWLSPLSLLGHCSIVLGSFFVSLYLMLSHPRPFFGSLLSQKYMHIPSLFLWFVRFFFASLAPPFVTFDSFDL